MDIETIRNYCIQKRGVTEEFPFGPDTLVFKVMGKMFALIGLDNKPYNINLKCDPVRAVELREENDGLITAAYHMNKKHWNSILPEFLPMEIVKELIEHSYGLVVGKLTRKQKDALGEIS